MDELSLHDYMRLVGTRAKLIVVCTVVALVVAGVVLAVMPRTFEARTTLLFPENDLGSISPQLTQLMSFMLPGAAPQSFNGRDVYISVLKSRTISRNVCERMDLDRYGVSCKDLLKKIKIEPTKEGSLEITCRAPTSWLKGHVPGDELRERSAELAAEVANTYISELERYDRSNSLFMGKKNRRYIETQVVRAKTDLSGAESRLRAFQQEHPTLIPPDKSDGYADQVLKLYENQIEADVGLEEARSQLERARATWKAGAPKGISPEALIDSEPLAVLRTNLARLEVKHASLLENFTPEHPDVVALKQEIDKTYATIRGEVGRLVGGKASSMAPAHQELLKQIAVLEVTHDGMAARKAALAKAASSIEGRLSKLPAEEIRYARLLRDLRAAETVYMTLLAELAKARVAEGRDTDNFIVLDRAVAPEKPARPNVPLSLAMAVSFGALFGILIATVQGTNSMPERK